MVGKLGIDCSAQRDDDIAAFSEPSRARYLGVDIAWDIVERDLPNLARVTRVELVLRR